MPHSSAQSPAPGREPSQPVLLYDGECGLCNRTVRLLLKLDASGKIRYAPLQGPSAQEFLADRGLPTQDFSSLVFIPDWQNRRRGAYHLRTDGVIAALMTCGGTGATLAAVLRLVPRVLRDAGYRMVARFRYRIFGPWKACPLPRPEWAKRFID